MRAIIYEILKCLLLCLGCPRRNDKVQTPCGDVTGPDVDTGPVSALESCNGVNLPTTGTGDVRSICICRSSKVHTLAAGRHTVLEAVDSWEIPGEVLGFPNAIESRQPGPLSVSG